jgi:hypothetical protein
VAGITGILVDSPRVSSLDVVRNVLDDDYSPDELRRLDSARLGDVADALRVFYLRWTAPPLERSELRASVGEKYGGLPEFIGDLALYVDTVVIPDPLEEWLERFQSLEKFRHGSGAVDDLACAVAALRRYEGCMQHGFVIAAPPPGVLSSWGGQTGPGSGLDMSRLARELARDYRFAEGMLPLRVDIPERLRSIPGTMDQWARYFDEAYDGYLTADIDSDLERAYDDIVDSLVGDTWRMIERMCHAIHAGARFMPLSSADDAAIAGGLNVIARRLGVQPEGIGSVHEQVVRTLFHADVPALHKITPELAVSVREEDGFEEWRAVFRSVVLEAEGLSQPWTDQLIADRLFLAAKATERSVSRSRALSSAFRAEWRQAMVELPLWAAVSTIVPAGKFITAARATGSFARVFAEAIGPHSAEGANAVIVKLVNR